MKKKKWLYLILVFLFSFITILVLFNKVSVIDNFGYKVVRSLECVFFDKYFVFITKFGNVEAVFGIVLVFILLFRNRHSVMFALLAISSASTNILLKHIIQRERPTVLKLVEQGGYSYPSGHSMIAVCVYGYLLYIAYKSIKNKYIKCVVCTILSIFILSIGISRIYVGVHYTSDVIGGFLLATFELILLIDISKKLNRGN